MRPVQQVCYFILKVSLSYLLGTQISVFGVVRALPAGFSPPTSTYVVDGGNPVSYIAPNLTTNEGDNILFFASDTLAAAQHLLVITITRVSPEAPYLLDYVTFSPVASATPSKSSANNPPPSTPTPTPSSTPTPTLSPSPTPPASQASTPVASNTPSVSQSPSSAALSASASSPSISASANTMQTILQSESHAP